MYYIVNLQAVIITPCNPILPEVAQKEEKKKVYTKQTSKRNHTRKYYINEKKICKTAFLKTLQMSQNRIDVALKKSINNMEIVDERGPKSGGKNKCTNEQVLTVEQHINSFPKYVSHYCRNETNSKFLNPNLNLTKMYDLYKSLCSGSKPVSLAT